MKLFKIKKHEFDDYFYGLVLSKSRMLSRYVLEHPKGSDYARKLIIEAKANIAKMNPILRGFLIRALAEPTSFRIQRTTYWCNIEKDVGIEYIIENTYPPYGNMHYRENDKKIYISGGDYELTSEKIDRIIFSSVYDSIFLLNKNREAMDFNVKKRKNLQKYMEHYGKEY